MSLNTRSPLRTVGGVNQSGQINDGFVGQNVGGQRAYSVYSGGLLTLGSGTVSGINGPFSVTVGGNAVIVSGPGRLNTAFLHQIANSGSSPIVFYDSNVAAVSGVASFAASGFTVIGTIPGWPVPASGSVYQQMPLIERGGPFYNGLGVSAASGAPGFTATYTISNESYQGP